MIEIIKKLEQIGPNLGITLSRKELLKLGAVNGDEIRLRIELANKRDLKSLNEDRLMRDYIDFVNKYGEVLKNLASID